MQETERGKIGDDLVAGGLETTLETKRWKIGDDTGDLGAGRLETTLET